MLKAEDNEILTRVGPGTLMGELLRRYWTPACLTAEIPEPGGAPARVRLLGENLVAFRDTTGRIGLVQENCPHRGASLYFGRNEDAALRCVYHGWAYDTEGRCVDMPSEPAPFCEKVRMRAYPAHESGGIVWAYLGPRETMTPFRDFGSDGLDAAEFIATKQHSTCNWVQAMEGNIDTAHISHLHQWDGIDDIPDDGSDKPGYPSNAMSWKFWRHDRAPRLELDDTWYGYRYAGIRTTPNGNTHVRITAYAVPYHTMVASIPFSAGQGMFIPIDDNNCWRYFTAPKDLAEPARPRRREPVLHRPVLHPGIDRHRRHRAAPVHRGERLPDRPGGAAELHVQRRRGLRQPGPDGDRVDGPDLRPHPGAARLHRQGHQPDAAPPASPRPRAWPKARSRPPSAPAWTSRPSAAPRRSSNPAKTGACSAPATTRSFAKPSALPPASS